MVVIDLWKALRAGKQLKDSKTWANTQSLTNVCVTILTFSIGAARLFGLDIPITDEQLISLGGGIAIVLGVVNSIVSVATTKNAGIKLKEKEDGEVT